jgi:hypothetical protein
MSTQERRELADERSEIELLLDAHDRAMWNWRALAERGCTTEEYNAADDARDATRKAIEDYFAVLRGEQPVESGQREPSDDIAFKLRARALSLTPLMPRSGFQGSPSDIRLMEAASDEIERLRGVVRLLREADPRVAANREAIRAYEKATAEQGK